MTAHRFECGIMFGLLGKKIKIIFSQQSTFFFGLKEEENVKVQVI